MPSTWIRPFLPHFHPEARGRGVPGFLALVAILVLPAPWAAAQWVTQTQTLQPGWNAVFLEVQPEPRDIAKAFQGVPVERVLFWNKRFSSVQYLENMDKLLAKEPDWLVWHAFAPSTLPSTLFTLLGGRGYLVKVGGGVTVNWSVTGQPALRPIEWVPNSYNLVGFGIDPAYAPTFQKFFAASPAHAGKKVARLNAQGQWDALDPATATMRRYEAFWIYTEGSSTFQGPVSVVFDQGSGLEYGRLLVEQTLRIRNASPGASAAITLTPGGSGAPPSGSFPVVAGTVPLSYFVMNLPGQQYGWQPFGASLGQTIPAGGELALRLEVRRRDMATPPAGVESLYQSLLTLTDGQGVRLTVPVSAKGLVSSAALARAGQSLSEEATRYTGLWVGTAVLNAVSEAETDPATATPASSEFQLRLIVHVDSGGTARLLQKVLMMYRKGSYKTDPGDPTGLPVVDQGGEYVLLADDTPGVTAPYVGAAVRDTDLVARRISTTAFSFEKPQVMTGEFGSALQCDLGIDYRDRLNPFVHAYHPDHNNLDEDYSTVLAEGRESFTVSRSLDLTFLSKDPQGLEIAGWGDTHMGGVYQEWVEGLHRAPILTQGHFRLVRVSRLGELIGQ